MSKLIECFSSTYKAVMTDPMGLILKIGAAKAGTTTSKCCDLKPHTGIPGLILCSGANAAQNARSDPENEIS
jgi:hypothetical protein